MDINNKIEIIKKQTDYDDITAQQKLKEYDMDEIRVIKAYLGIKEKETSSHKSLQQEMYKQIRLQMDVRSYNEKQNSKLSEQIEKNISSFNRTPSFDENKKT